MYTRTINLSGYYEDKFTYTYTSVCDRARMLTQYHLSTFKDEKTGEMLLELFLSNDESTFIEGSIFKAINEIGSIFLKSIKNGLNPTYFTANSNRMFGIYANDYGYVTPAVIAQVDNLIQDAIAYYVIKEWYGLKAPKEREFAENDYNTRIRMLNQSLYYFIKRPLTFIAPTEPPTPPYIPALVIMYYIGEYTNVSDLENINNAISGYYAFVTSNGSYYAYSEGQWYIVTIANQIADCELLKACYGITWNRNDSSSLCTAIGNIPYSYTLPFHIFERGTVDVDQTGNIVFTKLDPANTYNAENTQPLYS